jgi:uroporphyrinogen-III synthase
MNAPGINGKTIIVTRSVDDSIDDFARLSELGAKLIHFPTLDYKPVDDWTLFDEVIAKKDEIDFLIFTSSNSVRFFAKRCEEKAINWSYDKTEVIVAGKKTALTCSEFNIPVSVVPEEFGAEGIINFFEKLNVTGKSIFIPGSELSRKDLAENLRAKGNKVFAIPIYKVGLPEESIVEKNLTIIKNEKPDLFVFTSPSTFKNFIEILNITEPQMYFCNAEIAAIGATTKKEIEDTGIKVRLIPASSTIEDIITEIIYYYNQKLETGENFEIKK